MLLNWVIAFLGLVFYFADRLDMKNVRHEFKFKFFVLDNLKELILGFISVVILMLILTELNSEADLIENIKNKWEIFKYIPVMTLLSVTIGLFNFGLLRGYRKFVKKKAADKGVKV